MSSDIHSLEAEKALLASIFIDPARLIEVDSILKSAEDFFLLRNRVIYTAMQRVHARQDAIDPVTVADALESSGDLETVGGLTHLLEIMNSAGTSVHAGVYAGLVQRTAIRRRGLKALDEMRGLLYDESLNIDEVRAKADATWLNVTADITQSRGAWVGDVVSGLHDRIEAAMRQNRTIAGISTGLRDVDSLTQGFEPETLTVIAGRPGMGKSAAMDNMCISIAKSGLPVFYATSERSKDDVVMRMHAILSGVNSLKIRNGNMTRQESARYTDSIGILSELPVYIDDNPMPRPRDIYARADWLIKRHGFKIILFDGMYRSETGDPEKDRVDRTKYGGVALELKTLARSLGVPVVTTHQLSRSVEHRQDKRPKMADLRESGRIEEEADKIIFLYRDVEYNPATEFPNACDWIVAKHRNGQTGTVTTHYESYNTKFSNATVTRVDLNEIE